MFIFGVVTVVADNGKKKHVTEFKHFFFYFSFKIINYVLSVPVCYQKLRVRGTQLSLNF